MVNKHTVDCQPSPSGLTSRIHLLIFRWIPQGLSLQIIVEFFLKPVYFTMVKISPMGRIFKFMVLRLLENVFVSRKNESFYSSSHAPEQTPSRFLLSHPQRERYYTFPPGSFFF